MKRKLAFFVPVTVLALLPVCTMGSANTHLPREPQTYTNKDLEDLPPPPAGKVYTNKDLEDLPPLPTVLPAAGAAPEAASSAVDQATIEAAKTQVAALSARVDELGNRLLAIRNPFWPRPRLEPEEAQAWEGLDGKARAERVEQQLAQARAELAAAEVELSRVRRSSEL